MINNLPSYDPLFSNNTVSNGASEGTSQNKAVDELIAKHKSTAASGQQTNVVNQSNLYLSDRSQKISLLSSEFLTSGDMSFTNVQALKERAYQFGLISKEEYQRLSNVEVDTDDVGISAEKMSITTLSSFIGDFLIRLNKDGTSESTEEKDDSEDEQDLSKNETFIALNKALNSAKDILSNIEKAKQQDGFKADLKQSISFIRDTINTEAFEKMPTDDKIGLSKVYQALEIVDKISPQRLSNEKVNKYIDLSFS